MRRVRFAEDDGASLTQSGSHTAVVLGHVVLEELRTVGGTQAARWLEVFYGNWQTVEGAEGRTLHDGLLGLASRRSCWLRIQCEERVQPRLELLGAPQRLVQQLDGR